MFTVYNASSRPLIRSQSYLEARRRWSEYMSTSPAPSELAGLDCDGWRIDIEALDRWTGYGSPTEREPTESEIRHATL